jgi:hypothetical protein
MSGGGGMAPPIGFNPAQSMLPQASGAINPFSGGFFNEPIHIIGAGKGPVLADYKPDKLTLNLGDIHIYEQHMVAVKEQLKRIPFDFPQLKINKTTTNIEEYEWSDIELINYNSHPVIKAPIIA